MYLGTDSTITAADTVAIEAETIVDPDETCEAGGTAELDGSFGDMPRVILARLEDAPGLGGGIQAGDTVTVGFDQPTNGLEIDSEVIDDARELEIQTFFGMVVRVLSFSMMLWISS